MTLLLGRSRVQEPLVRRCYHSNRLAFNARNNNNRGRQQQQHLCGNGGKNNDHHNNNKYKSSTQWKRFYHETACSRGSIGSVGCTNGSSSSKSSPPFSKRNKTSLHKPVAATEGGGGEEEEEEEIDDNVSDSGTKSPKDDRIGKFSSHASGSSRRPSSIGRPSPPTPSPPPLSPSPPAQVLDRDDNDKGDDDESEIIQRMTISNDLMEKNLNGFLDRIEKQELDGGRMRTAQLGVLHEDPNVDMRLLMENYTVPALASALRDREDVLQQCATWMMDMQETNMAKQLDGKNRVLFEQLTQTLINFHPKYVIERRKQKRQLNLLTPSSDNTDGGFDESSLEIIRKALSKMPRRVTQPHTQRAGVVIPICLEYNTGVPSILLQKRSPHTPNHANEVCLPGGMVCSINDTTIVSTCLREMKEEIRGLNYTVATANNTANDNDNNNNSLYNNESNSSNRPEVLGILRCNWGDVHHLVGVAVTPVVCYIGELPTNCAELDPDPDEVAQVFTIPLVALLDETLWVHKDGLAPIFIGGQHVIWGLTGYILHRFVKDILLPKQIMSKEFENATTNR